MIVQEKFKFGLIGGVGPLTTVPYYMGILNGVQKRSGRAYFPHLSIESLSCFEVIPMAAAGRFDELTAYFLKGVNNLVAAGANAAAIACITGHTVFDELQKRSPIELIHILEPTVRDLTKLGAKRIAFIGTEASMNSKVFREYFQARGIAPEVPDEKGLRYIAQIIETELEYGIVKDKTVKQVQGILEELVSQKRLDAICLGCTELPLLFKKCTMPVPVIDPVPLHIAAIVDLICRKEGFNPI